MGFLLSTYTPPVTDLAYDFITQSHFIAECMEAISHGHDTAWLHAWDTKPTDVYEHLEKVAAEAHELGDQLNATGRVSAAEAFYKLDVRLRALCRRGRSDVAQARIDLIHLTCAAEILLE